MELYASDHPDHALTDPAGALSAIPRDGRRRRPDRGQRFAPGANHVAAECLDARTRCTWRWTGPTPTSSTTRRSASSATAASAPARRCRAPSRSPSRAAASRAASSPAWTRTSSPRNASPAAPACSPARPARSPRRRSFEIGTPEHSKITTCAYCGVGCAFKAEMRGEEVVRMVPWKDGKANRGHSCVKGRFAYGYATHRERILKPMVREKITDPWRETTWEEAIGRVASEFRRIQAEHGQGRGRRHHLVALHQRGDLPRPEADPPGLRREQRRHLRPGLPLADRLRPQGDLRRERRHPGLRQRRGLRRDARHRRQPDRRPPGLRQPDEAAPAPGRAAHRRRPAPRSTSCARRTSRPTTTCAPARHQRRAADRDGARHRHRGAGRRRLHPRPLRRGGLPEWAEFVAGRENSPEAMAAYTGVDAGAGPRGGPALRHRRQRARSTTASASPSTARARPR